jgi:hypothetical protein
VWSGTRELSAAQPAPVTSLNHVVGPDRNLALIRTGIGQVKQIAHAHHATVNDVLLAITAGGVRGLLHTRGEPVEDPIVRIDVPVTLRPACSAARGRWKRTLAARWPRSRKSTPMSRCCGRSRRARRGIRCWPLPARRSFWFVGCRGRGGVHGMSLGSVAQAPLHYAPCPVAVIRPPAVG